MEAGQSIDSYPVKDGSLLEYKPRLRRLNVRLTDGTSRELQVKAAQRGKKPEIYYTHVLAYHSLDDVGG